MSRYRGDLDPIHRMPIAPEPHTPETKAAHNFVLASHAGEELGADSIAVLSEAFKRVLAGEKGVFDLGKVGGQVKPGFTKPDIVSCFIERERRRLEPDPEAELRAQEVAATAFIYLGKAQDPMRDIRRQWGLGKAVAERLSDTDLDRVLAPYEVPLPAQRELWAATLGPSKEEVAHALDIDVDGTLRDMECMERLKAEQPERLECLKKEYLASLKPAATPETVTDTE